MINLQIATLSNENHRNTHGYKRKQTQGIAYVMWFKCNICRTISQHFPNLDNL